MIFNFYPDMTPDAGEAEVISGAISNHFNGTEYLVVRNREQKRAFKIFYEYHCSPFKEAAIVDNLLLVGHEEHFYLYDLTANHNILVLKMNGYFGSFYIDKYNLFVADANGIFRINMNGAILWYSEYLGIDGVIIGKISETEIQGSGEMDPPGGWKDFIIDKKTGKVTK